MQAPSLDAQHQHVGTGIDGGDLLAHQVEVFRLRIRFERRADIHEAFLKLGWSLVCWNIFRRTEQSF
ncbi:ISJP4 transposase TnpA [Cupriavidus sp. GA3-3]|nr:ISJP4 transposase TnpA [Cupriavidus sp. GA3-3]